MSEWLAVVGGICSGITVASLTHWFSVRRENNAKRYKIIGRLRLLSNYLKQIRGGKDEDIMRSIAFDPNRDKLRWWSDQTLQLVGDSLHILDRSSYDGFFSLLEKCWNNYPLGKGNFIFGGRRFALYDEEKIEKMEDQITGLIEKIEPRDCH